MLSIRGLSDIVGLKRQEAWTRYACSSAAGFTRGYLRTRPVPLRESPKRPAGPVPPLPQESGETPSPRAAAVEESFANLIPLRHFPDTLYVAPAHCKTKKQSWFLLMALPSITHLLAREACLCAVVANRNIVTTGDLNQGMKEAVDSQLESVLEAYRRAVTAPRGIHFKPVLLACALAEKDDHGFFYANSVTGSLRLISRKLDRSGNETGPPLFCK